VYSEQREIKRDLGELEEESEWQKRKRKKEHFLIFEFAVARLCFRIKKSFFPLFFSFCCFSKESRPSFQ